MGGLGKVLPTLQDCFVQSFKWTKLEEPSMISLNLHLAKCQQFHPKLPVRVLSCQRCQTRWHPGWWLWFSIYVYSNSMRDQLQSLSVQSSLGGDWKTFVTDVDKGCEISSWNLHLAQSVIYTWTNYLKLSWLLHNFPDHVHVRASDDI